MSELKRQENYIQILETQLRDKEQENEQLEYAVDMWKNLKQQEESQVKILEKENEQRKQALKYTINTLCKDCYSQHCQRCPLSDYKKLCGGAECK